MTLTFLKRNSILTLLLALLSFSVGCNKTRIKNALLLGDPGLGNLAKSCDVTYKEHIVPLLQSSCIKCHTSGGIASFRPLDTFSTVVAHRMQIVEQVKSKLMPPMGQGIPLSSDEINLIETWSANGHPESKENCRVAIVPEEDCKERVPQTARNARRLTNFEFIQTIKDVFGANASLYAQNHFQRLPVDNNNRKFFDTEVPNPLESNLIDIYQTIAEELGSYFIQGNGQRAELHPCLNHPTPDINSCIKPWITDLGAKAFRRPLTSEEAASYVNLYQLNQIVSVNDAIQMVVSGFIQSPFFMHHLELDLGGKTATNNIYALNQFELASRLSYALWGSAPDQALMTLAKNNQLSTLEQVKAEAKRMIGDPKARNYTSNFFKQYFGVNQIASPNPSTDFLQGLTTPGLSQAAAAEVEAFSLLLFDENKPYSDFFMSRKTYLDPNLPGSETLKAVYGVNTTGAVELPAERLGILTRAGLLFNSGNHAKPIVRGVSIRNYILCDEPPPPPPGADSTPQILDPDMNSNMRAHALTSGGNCFACHSRINPPGFLLASFDPIGRFRTAERLFDTAGTFIKNVSFKLDYTPVIESTTEAPVEGVSGFMKALSESDVPLNCFSKRRLEFLEGSKSVGLEKCVVKDIAQGFKKGGVRDLITGVITPEFLLRKVEE